jgi:hypothetical protein
MTLRPATTQDFSQFYVDISNAYVIDDNGILRAFGGIMRREDGRLWAWIDTRPGVNPIALVKSIRGALKRCRETVYVPCEAHRFPTAERLLGLLGFVPTEETHNDMRVWRHG